MNILPFLFVLFCVEAVNVSSRSVLTKYIAKWFETTPQILEMHAFKDNHMFT